MTTEHHRVVIVGAGFGGIGAAVRLLRKGISDFVILEAAGAPGGTWRDNSYPGCQCDIPSNLYSLSFAPNPAWSTTFPIQPEIREYIERVVTQFDLHKFTRYHTELLDARWDASSTQWRVVTSAGELSANVLILAMGFLSEPFVPALDGLDSFRGPTFHSARWDHDIDLTGKRVAVVGTGASAVQLIPEIAPRVGHLDVYQRTPAWVIPHMDRRVTRPEQWLYRTFPVAQGIRRAMTYVVSESRHAVLTRTGLLNRAARALARANIRRAVPDPELVRRLTPSYELGCKRVLLSNRYYPALARPNVDVVSDRVIGATPTGVVTGSGDRRPADVIIFATGFKITNRACYQRIRGEGGTDLASSFDEHGAYLGVTAAGFPNLFCIAGPTSGVGHTSFLFMIESQQAYVADAVAAMVSRSLGSVEVRPEVQDGYFHRIQSDTTRKVWASGCTSWFLDEKGRNVAVWPGYSWTFHRRTRRFDEKSYHVTADTAR
ncbi:MAG TPA: NAD(P)/FAD-dependent oxidoreductase [Micromonosporaceae bacterium]|nr:NAD(P)/FAD-dependent oxidoreductase [Micromonosporaceae bacterium]